MSDVDQVPQANRFVFDRVFNEKPFNGDATLSRFEPPHPAAGAEAPQFSESDLESARQFGYEEGLRQGSEDGRREGAAGALSQAEAQTNAAFALLAEQLAALAGRQDEMFAALGHDCERLVRIVLDRLLPELVRRGGAEEILGVVRTALSIACNDPVVEVRVPHDVVDGIRPRIARLTRDLAFRGRVDLHGDSFLTDGMVRVRWLHGGAQRDPDQMLTEVTAIIARVLEREGVRTDPPAAEAAAPTDNERTEK